MAVVSPLEPSAVAAVRAIRSGRVVELEQLLAADPGWATARLGDEGPQGTSRTLLHVATDWPGHHPRVAETVAVLVAAGADIDARFHGPHRETPLHWAASSDDVDALGALLVHGADIDADGGVIGGGTPLRDATAFGCWNAARALVARGAHAGAFDLAALGMTDDLLHLLGRGDSARTDEINHALWSACHGNQVGTAQRLVGLGADIDWLPAWERATPLDIAARAGAHDVLRWLHGLGARRHDQLDGGPAC